MKTAAGKLAAALERLGFTPLEAEVYTFLVGAAPATGYRIAQALGRPVSNIYKTVESLEQKGAVLVGEDHENRIARAVEPDELIARLESEFQEACRTARARLGPAADPEPEPDELLYRIVDRRALFERSRRVIRHAQRFLLVSACPGPLAELQHDLAEAAKRIPVLVKAYGPAQIDGVHIVQDPRGQAAIDAGPGQWLEITADGDQLVHGVLDHDSGELHLGQWTQNAMLNWMAYTGRWADIVLAAVRAGIDAGEEAPGLRAILDQFRPFATPASAGKMRMVSRYRRPSPAGRKR